MVTNKDKRSRKSTLRERGASLRAFREYHGITMAEFGKMADLAESSISRFEGGHRDLSPDAAARVEKAMAMFQAMTIKQIHIKARIKAGKTQEEIAREAGIDPLTYSMWEADQRPLTIEEMIRATDALGTVSPNASFSDSRLVSLASLAGPQRVFDKVWNEERGKEVDRVTDIIEEQEFQKEMAQKPPAEQAASFKRLYEAERGLRKSNEERISSFEERISLYKEMITMKDREIQALREQLEAKKKAITVPPQEE